MTIKQQQTIDKIKTGRPDVQFWVSADGVMTADKWPAIKVGKRGRPDVQVRSYPENGKDRTALTAALIGDQLLVKQTVRDWVKRNLK